MLELAQYPNAFMKIPGLGEFCARPMPFQQPYPFAEVPPLIEMAIDAFGAERLMWGSDFPPVANREGYANALRFARERVEARGKGEAGLIFGDAATAMWNLGR